MSRLRVGCVGGGFIAGRHLAVLSGLPNVQIVAVADADPARAEATAARYGARAYDSGLALMADEDLDAVWLCVPPFAHGPLELAAVDRDLPFFVEKPLALDLAVATDVARRVGERGLLTAVGYHWRHLQLVEQAGQLLQDTPAQLAVGRWLDSTPAVPWWSRRDQSGGQMIEQTTHLFDLARLLLGEAVSVDAVEHVPVRPGRPDADVPTASTATLVFASGAIATIVSSCLLSRRHDVGLQLVTEARTVELSERGLSDHTLRVVSAHGEQVLTSLQDPVEAEDREFVAALGGQVDRVRVPYDEALRTQALVCAADRSAREGVRVSVPARQPDA